MIIFKAWICASQINYYFSNTLPAFRWKAYLFGSRSRNESNAHSDIDILVELDHSQPIGMKFFVYQADLEELLHKKVDLVTTEGLSRHIKPFIDQDKILIYERIRSKRPARPERAV